MRTLADIKLGKSATIRAVDGPRVFRRRLLEMGLIPGVEVRVVTIAPLGDPLRIEIVRLVDAEGEILCTELYERLGLPNSTGSYHLRQLREAGVTRARASGTKRMISLRREDLESRFPGLLDLVLNS